MYEFRKKLGEIIDEINTVLETINGTIDEIQEGIDVLQQEIEQLQQEIDDLKNKIPLYPAPCLLDPTGTLCLIIETTQLTLETTRLNLELAEQSLQLAEEIHVIAIAHVRLPLLLWRDQIEKAVKQYIITSQEVAEEIMKGSNGDPESKLEQWACKWAPAFIAIPNVVTLPLCETNEFIGEIGNGVSSFRSMVSDSLGILGWAIDPMQKVDELIENELKPEFENLAMDITEELTSENSIMVSLLRMRMEEHGADALNAEFSADSSSKGLLLIPDIANRIDADMHLTGEGYFDPEKFNVIYDAIVISKLLLLGPAELNRLTQVAGVADTAYGENLYDGPEDPFHENPFNILFGAIRSIDGNQQWQEYGVPYPRLNLDDRPPDSMPPESRQYGYGFDRAQGLGFRLWQDCEAQEKVFKQIFHSPVAPGIEEPSSLGLSEILHELDLNRADSIDKPFPMPLIEDRDGDGIKDECDPGPATLPVGSSQLYSSIQKAIDYAWEGDTVLVYNGIYHENINFHGKAITVRSKNGADSTTIDGGAGGSVVTFSSGEIVNSILEGFRITNGSALAGTGGIFIDGSSPLITDCIISSNLGDGVYASGGSARVESSTVSNNGNHGVSCNNSTFSIIDCTVSGNSNEGISSLGGSLKITNSIVSGNSGDGVFSSQCVIERSTISDNGGYGINFSGGIGISIIDCTINGNTNSGVYASGGSMRIENSRISDNTAHGVHCTGSLQITISDSTISGNSTIGGGGGIFTENSSLLTLINSTVSGNSAGMNGGGIYCYEDSSPTIINCTFSDNSALLMGGGIYCHSGSSPTLNGCTINGNSAEFGGGVYCSENSSPTLTNSHITNNSASSILMGGGIYSMHSSLTIANTIIDGNSTMGGGGGIYCFDSSSLSITHGIISGNTASYGGGGIYCQDNILLTVENCTIRGNSADSGGGIYSYGSSSLSLVNSIISGNSSNEYGGGIFCASSSSSPMITNCTISGNSTIGSGGGIYCAFNYMPMVVTNSILWGDTAGGSPNEVYLEDAADSITITFSNINPSVVTGSGISSFSDNIDGNPLFVDSANSDYRLQTGSPCIDKGTSGGAPTSDIEGTSRPQGSGYDMGAYEYCVTPVAWYKDADGDGYSDGKTLTQCPRPENYYLASELTATSGDCNDSDANINPGANEVCDGVDNDCDSETVENCDANGDVNGDDNVTPADALMAFQYYLGLIQLNTSQQDRADVNNSGSITPADALCIFQQYLGLPSCLD